MVISRLGKLSPANAWFDLYDQVKQYVCRLSEQAFAAGVLFSTRKRAGGKPGKLFYLRTGLA